MIQTHAILTEKTFLTKKKPRKATAVSDNSHKVGVYDNNQAIIKDEELDRTGHSYLKHFYEKNEPVAEVDEFI